MSLPARLTLSLCLLLLAGALMAPVAGAWDSSNPTSGPSNPLAGQKWFVDWKWGMSQRQYKSYRHHRQRYKASLIYKLARQPQTKRFGTWDPHPSRAARAYLNRMRETAPGAMTFLYVYRFKHTGCGARATYHGKYQRGYDAGGSREATRYRAWIDGFARGVGTSKVAIWLEPDGLGTMECLSANGRRIRYSLFHYAIDRLSRNPNAAIYLDGGASDWLKWRTQASLLRKAGVGDPRVRGFFLNATHFDWTNRNIRYGDVLARALGGKHYVISTAANGRGPYRLHRAKRSYDELRCNPPGRALGPEPTVRTASIWADAYFFIGDPGRSAGTCHGGPPTGSWFPNYALALAKRANWK
jgi:endoglucanase